jgi:hypothetical protein
MIGGYPEFRSPGSSDCGRVFAREVGSVVKRGVQQLRERTKVRGWEPTLTQLAERANKLWHQDGCPAVPEVTYWMRARQELIEEHNRVARQTPERPRAAYAFD